MRWMVMITLFIAAYGSTHANAENIQYDLPGYGEQMQLRELSNDELLEIVNQKLITPDYSGMPSTNQEIKKKKIIAITLAVTLGVFGVHRLYLGTATKVPIIYTLTLGGGFGFLVVSDIIAIIATKNMDKFSPNTQAFMWAE